ncbi:MAG TPA: trypsin-like peptidase domain-containing protein [Candidatus Kapabacteria bacterium]|nr:trypsin-like peptidase domain-containing protein [Candidatus Kapabacteria bacterium]
MAHIFKKLSVVFILLALVATGVALMKRGGLTKDSSPIYTDAKATPSSPATSATAGDADGSISASRQNAITRTVAKCSQAVVGITVTAVQTYTQPGLSDPFGFFQNDPYFKQYFGSRTYKQTVKALGSGFVISSDGDIITNDHVAGNATKVIVTMTGGKQYDAKLIGTDAAADIALLKIDGDNLPYLELGNSDDVIVGEWAIAFGNPFGLFESNDHPTVTVGVISNENVNLQPMDDHTYRHMIQTDAAINPGNSGGPLINADGEVIGVNAAIINPNGNEENIGLGFAIPINNVKKIVDILRKNGKIKHITQIGFRYKQMTKELASYFHLDQTDGVVVTQIQSGSGAANSGLEVGDVITEAGGETIRTEDDLTSILLSAQVGDELHLKIYRYGERKDITLSLDGSPD